MTGGKALHSVVDADQPDTSQFRVEWKGISTRIDPPLERPGQASARWQPTRGTRPGGRTRNRLVRWCFEVWASPLELAKHGTRIP